ncbi:MAG: hypothetical protein LBM09_02740 [Candidatus Nomurabacteria bacterium]|nr:hypothetical protein [Candidatus Nomurabacteria bacterium]
MNPQTPQIPNGQFPNTPNPQSMQPQAQPTQFPQQPIAPNQPMMQPTGFAPVQPAQPIQPAQFAQPQQQFQQAQQFPSPQSQPQQTNQYQTWNSPMPPAPSFNGKVKGKQNEDLSALLALIVGGAMFLYLLIIIIARPSRITIWWYLAFLPIILGITGIKSQKRRPLAIAGLALGVLSFVLIFILFKTIYTIDL